MNRHIIIPDTSENLNNYLSYLHKNSAEQLVLKKCYLCPDIKKNFVCIDILKNDIVKTLHVKAFSRREPFEMIFENIKDKYANRIAYEYKYKTRTNVELFTNNVVRYRVFAWDDEKLVPLFI